MPTLKKHTAPKQRYHSTINERQKVYNTSIWRKLRQAKLMTSPLCEVCKKAPAYDVHHKESFVNKSNWQELAFDSTNLLAVCRNCHNEIHNNLNTKNHEKIKKFRSENFTTV